MVRSTQLSCGKRVASAPLVMTQILTLFVVLAFKTLPLVPSPLITHLSYQDSCIIAIHVCTTDMLLVKITEALLLWCMLICMMGMLKLAGPASLFSSLLPLHALVGSFTVAQLSLQ
jgi:hypothetical protein